MWREALDVRLIATIGWNKIRLLFSCIVLAL